MSCAAVAVPVAAVVAEHRSGGSREQQDYTRATVLLLLPLCDLVVLSYSGVRWMCAQCDLMLCYSVI